MVTTSTVASSSRPVLNTPSLIALVALKGYAESKKGNRLYIEDLSKYLIELKHSGVNISRISLNVSVGKYWSEDIAQFVSEGILFGDIKHKSPIEFTEKCVHVCESTLAEYSSENEEVNQEILNARKILSI